MNKFILVVLLIFVQSKKLNTFQEYDFRNLEVTEEEKEKLRNNQELKEIAYKFYDLFKQPADDNTILAAIKDNLNKIETIVVSIIPDYAFIFTILKNAEDEQLICTLKDGDKIDGIFNECMDLFFQKKDKELKKKCGNLDYKFGVKFYLTCMGY